MASRIPALRFQRLFATYGAEFCRHLQRDYGDFVWGKAPFFPQTYFLFHPDQVHEVLVTQAAQFQKPRLIRRVLQSSFGNGLFSSSGDLWRQQRRLMQPTFHHARISTFAERLTQQALKLRDTWQDGATRVIDADMHALTFNIVAEALFSADASGRTDQIAQAMHDLGQGIGSQGSSPLLTFMPDWVPVPTLRLKRRGSQALTRSVQQLIAERRTLGEANSPPDLLSALLFTRDETTGAAMSDAQLRDELVTLYIAGHDTTAVLLGWAWMLLAQNPAAERQLHAELDGLGGRAPTLADPLPYTRQIIKEALRLYPPAWFLFREPLADLTVGGETLLQGSLVFIFPYATQRDPRWFDQPDDFRPERWTEAFEKSLPKGAYIPFGTGPRICIGNGFAQMEAQLILATLAQQYRVELLQTPQPVASTTILGFAEPVSVRLHRR